jgi:hypothetical protein
VLFRSIGSGALQSNVTGTGNTAVGYNALNLATSSGNTAIGNNSLNANTTGADNVSIGSNSSQLNTSGNGNISIGSYALQKNITGTNNIAIGYNADVATSGLTNAIAIGYNSKNSNSNTIVLGNSQITSLTTSGKITTGTITLPNTDGTSGQVLTAGTATGTTIWSTPTATGLILISTTSFSGVASQPINDVFSATYDNYRILINATTLTGTLTMRLELQVQIIQQVITKWTYTAQLYDKLSLWWLSRIWFNKF